MRTYLGVVLVGVRIWQLGIRGGAFAIDPCSPRVSFRGDTRTPKVDGEHPADWAIGRKACRGGEWKAPNSK